MVGAGNTFREHPALRLMAMPAEEGGESLSDFMTERRDACIGRIVERVKAAGAEAAGFSLGDLTRMLHEAWTGGGSAMADGLAARDSARSLEMMRAMEAEMDRQRVRQAVTEMPAFALPWPGEAGLLSLMDGKGAR